MPLTTQLTPRRDRPPIREELLLTLPGETRRTPPAEGAGIAVALDCACVRQVGPAKPGARGYSQSHCLWAKCNPPTGVSRVGNHKA